MDRLDVPGYRLAVAGEYDLRYAATDDAAVVRAVDALAPFLDVVVNLLPQGGGTHLDVGSGSGIVSLATARSRPVVGIDISPAAVRLARAAAVRAAAPARFVEADALDPPVGPYQSVTAVSVFNLLDEKRSALAAWRRVTLADGVLVVADAASLGKRSDGDGPGPVKEATLAAWAAEAGWRREDRVDATTTVAQLAGAGHWPWKEYLRPGFPYVVHVFRAGP